MQYPQIRFEKELLQRVPSRIIQGIIEYIHETEQIIESKNNEISWLKTRLELGHTKLSYPKTRDGPLGRRDLVITLER